MAIQTSPSHGRKVSSTAAAPSARSHDGRSVASAVTALATLLPSWLRALGAAAVLLTFRPWLGLVWIAIWPLVLVVLMREFIRLGKAAGGYTASAGPRSQAFG